MTGKRLSVLVVLSILLIQAVTVLAFAQPEVPINVVDVAWGIAPNRLTVGPGDKAVPLTITIQNVGSDMISGISMYLELESPFTNLTNGRLASSYVSTSLQPGQSASAQFMLNVAENARTGEYSIPLTMEYLVVKQQTTSESSTTQDSYTSSSTSSSTENSIGESSTSQSQRSSTSGTQTTTSTSSTTFDVQKMTAVKEVSLWLSGKTIIEVGSPVNVLTAGQVNSFPITVRNSGSAGVSSLTISVSLQPSTLGSSASYPLIIQGADDLWYIQDFPAGSDVTLEPEIFASTEAIDRAYQIQVSLNYRDAVGVTHSEAYGLGLSVQGSIKIVMQSAFISPVPVGAGGNITVSGNLLNEGNVAAMYVNATASISPPFEMLDGSSNYLGELDPNTPLPFSLSIKILNGTANGTYPLNVVFYYKDSFGDTHSFDKTFNVTVSGVYLPHKPMERREFFLLTPIGLSLIVMAIAAIVVIAYIFGRRRAHR